MKKQAAMILVFRKEAVLSALVLALTAGSPAAASEAVVLSDTTVETPANRPEFDGRISKVDAAKGYIGVVDDANAKYRRVALKKGMIGSYKVGDRVRVKLRSGMNEAKEIRKID